MTQIKSIRPQWLWVVPILLLSFALTLPHFMQDAVWFDEAYTHLYSGTGLVPNMPLTRSLLLIAQTDPWPPGYYLLNIAWGRLTGTAEFSNYMLPALIGVLAISVVFKTVSKFYDLRSGLIASLMLATSAFFIHYTHEHRAYTLFVLVIALVFWFYWTMITRPNYKKRWLGWGFPLSIALALYTHYVAGAFVLGIMVYHLIFERPSISKNEHMSLKRWQDTIRLWINGCLIFTPWFTMLLGTLAAESATDRALPFFSLMGYALNGFTNNLWWIFAILILVSLLFWKLPQIRFVWTVFVVSLIVIFIINQFVSFLFHPRHILPYIIIMFLMVIPILNTIENKFRRSSAVIIGLYAGVGIVFSLTPNFMYQIPTHIHPIPLAAITEMQVVYEDCIGEDDLVLFAIDTPLNENIQEIALQYYFLGEGNIFTQLGRLTTQVDDELRSWDMLGFANAEVKIQTLMGESDIVWLMSLPHLDNKGEIMLFEDIMSENSYLQCPVFGNHVNITAYTRTETCDISCS